MNNGIITYSNQVYYKFLNDIIMTKSNRDFKFEELNIKSLNYDTDDPILKDFNYDIDYGEKIKIGDYMKRIKNIKEDIYKNTISADSYKNDDFFLERIDHILEIFQQERDRFDKNKKIFDHELSSITNINKNMKVRDINDLEEITRAIFSIIKNKQISSIITDIHLRYKLLFDALDKEDNSVELKSNNLKILKYMSNYLGNFSNISTKNMKQYLLNFINSIEGNRKIAYLEKYIKIFKRLNSYSYYNKAERIIFLKANLKSFLDDKLSRKKYLKFKKYLHKENLISKEEVKGGYFSLSKKIDVAKGISGLNDFPALEIDIDKMTYTFYNLNYYKIIIWGNHMGILDNSNMILIIKSLERLLNFHLYAFTQRLNADAEKKFANHIKYKDCFHEYLSIVKKTYETFVEKKLDLNKLPRYFFDFHDLVNALIANNMPYVQSFSKVNKILNIFQEKSYLLGNELDIAKNLINTYGLKIVLEITKGYKFLTTPDYNYLQAIKDLVDTFSTDSGYDESIFKEFDALQLRELCKLFYKKYQVYPAFDYPEYEVKYNDNGEEKIKKVKFGDLDFKPTKLPLEYWYNVKPKKIFPYTSYSNLYELEVKDKRKILNDVSYYSSYIDNSFLNKEVNSEILYALTHESSKEILEFKNGLLENKLPKEIPVVLAYKDEIHKPASRLFFMAPTELRAIISEMEYNLEKILNLKPGNVMTASNKIITEKLENIENITGLNEKFFSLLISFDLKKLSTRFPRNILRREMEKLSILFGEPLIKKIPDCIDATKIFHVSNSFYYSFKPEHGCYEGFFNKFWTNYHIDVMTFSVYKIKKVLNKIVDLDFHLSAFSDDGVLAIKSKHELKKDLQDDSFKEKISGKIYDSVKENYTKLGLIISEDKTYVSNNYAVFLNKIYYKGQYLQNPMKAFLRVSDIQINKVNTMYNRIQYLFSTIQGALTNGMCMIQAWVFFIYFSYRLLNKNYPAFKRMKIENQMLFMFTSKSLGGAGINSMQSLVSSLEYDKLCSSLYILSVIFLNNKELANKINNIINQPFKTFDLLNCGVDCLNNSYSQIQFSDSFFEQLTYDCLQNYVKNDLYNCFMNNNTIHLHTELLNSIWECDNLDLYLFNLIASLSPLNYFKNIINGIDKTDTVKNILKVGNMANLNKRLSVVDNAAITEFEELIESSSNLLNNKMNDYINYNNPIDIKLFKSSQEAFEMTVSLRKRYFQRSDLQHIAEVCCTLGIDVNMDLTASTLSKSLQDPDFKTKLLDYLLNLETSYQNTPIFSFIRKTDILTNYEYINDINEVNLKSYSLKVKGFQESNIPKFLDDSHFDSVISKIMLLDQLQAYNQINIKKTLYLLHIAWCIPLDKTNVLYHFTLDKNILAHLLIKKTNHSFLGERQSMDIQIVNARSVKKINKRQNFDIYRFLLNIRIITACELEIQNYLFKTFLIRMPVYFFNLTKIIFDPYNDIEANLLNTNHNNSINPMYIDTLELNKYITEYMCNIKSHLMISNNFTNTIWSELGKKVEEFVENNFVDGSEKFADEFNYNFDNYPEEFRYLSSLPSAKKEQVISFVVESRAKKKDNNDTIIVQDDSNSHKFYYNDRYLFDSIPTQDHFYSLFNSFVKNWNIKDYSLRKKEKGLPGKGGDTLTNLGRVIASVLYKTGTYDEKTMRFTSEYRDFKKIDQILKEYNFPYLLTNFINNNFSNFSNIKSKLLKSLEQSQNYLENNNIMKLPELFVNTIENLWATKNGKENPQYSWYFYFIENLKPSLRNDLLNRQIRSYLIFTNSLYKIYYKSKLNTLSNEISFSKNFKKREELNEKIFSRTLTQLKKSLLNIRLSGLYYIQGKSIFLDTKKLRGEFIKTVNTKLNKYYNNKNINATIYIVDIVYTSETLITWDYPERLTITFPNIDEEKLIRVLYENYYKFVRLDCDMFNANLYKINDDLDLTLTSNYFYSFFIPHFNNLDQDMVTANLIIVNEEEKNKEGSKRINFLEKQGVLESHTYQSENNAIYNYFIGSKDTQKESVSRITKNNNTIVISSEFSIPRETLNKKYETDFQDIFYPKKKLDVVLTQEIGIIPAKVEKKTTLVECSNINIDLSNHKKDDEILVKDDNIQRDDDLKIENEKTQRERLSLGSDLGIGGDIVFNGAYHSEDYFRIKDYNLNEYSVDLLLPVQLPFGFYGEDLPSINKIKVEKVKVKAVYDYLNKIKEYFETFFKKITVERGIYKNVPFKSFINKNKLFINDFEIMNSAYYIYHHFKAGGIDEDSLVPGALFDLTSIILPFLQPTYYKHTYQKVVYDQSFKLVDCKVEHEWDFKTLIAFFTKYIKKTESSLFKIKYRVSNIMKNLFCNQLLNITFHTHCIYINSETDIKIDDKVLCNISDKARYFKSINDLLGLNLEQEEITEIINSFTYNDFYENCLLPLVHNLVTSYYNDKTLSNIYFSHYGDLMDIELFDISTNDFEKDTPSMSLGDMKFLLYIKPIITKERIDQTEGVCPYNDIKDILEEEEIPISEYDISRNILANFYMRIWTTQSITFDELKQRYPEALLCKMKEEDEITVMEEDDVTEILK